MSRHKGIPSAGMIDRQFPNQVAIHADLVRGVRHARIIAAQAGLEHARKARPLVMIRPGGWQESYWAFCFARREDAQTFIDRVGAGEHFSPVWRCKGSDGSGAWVRPDMGNRLDRLPEIVGRLEQALGGEPNLETDIAWLLGVTRVRFTRERAEVEAFLRTVLPDGRWEIVSGRRVDARVQAGPGQPWFDARAAGAQFIDSEPVALTLAYVRLWAAENYRASEHRNADCQ